MTSLPSIDRSKQIGRSVGWSLVFPDVKASPENALRLSHATHYARVNATLPGTLDGGSFRIEIEALNSLDYGLIALARQPKGDGATRRPLVKAILTLYWRDKVGDEPTDAPITCVLAVTKLSRNADGSRIKTIIEGKDWIYQKLSGSNLSGNLASTGRMLALKLALKDAGLEPDDDFKLYPDTDEATSEPLTFEQGTPILDVLAAVGKTIADESNHRGRSLFLLRGGVLHAGAQRPIPFAEAVGGLGEVYRLTAEEGLVKNPENKGERKLTTAELRREAETSGRVSARDAYLLTMVGRPDVRPGDVVVIEVSGVEAADFGGFGMPPVPDVLGVPSLPVEREVYINSVQHRLGKNIGWVTTASGITVDTSSRPEGVWDIVEADQAGDSDPSGSDRDSADPAAELAGRIREVSRAAMSIRARPRVGEVRANHQETVVNDETVSAAAQSVDMFVGLASPDGKPKRARRQEVRRTGNIRQNIPYLTPFAWGPFGQVLPKYPGERVLVNFNEDEEQDPLVIGSFWRTFDGSEGQAPPNTLPGDWWLILPANLDESARQSVEGTEPSPPPGDTQAVHDLIDARGARVIQMRELTIRVLGENLEPVNDRPNSGAENGVLIEHHTGSRVHIDESGAITIESAKTMTLKAAEEVHIEGSSITLKGQSVDVIE